MLECPFTSSDTKLVTKQFQLKIQHSISLFSKASNSAVYNRQKLASQSRIANFLTYWKHGTIVRRHVITAFSLEASQLTFVSAALCSAYNNQADKAAGGCYLAVVLYNAPATMRAQYLYVEADALAVESLFLGTFGSVEFRTYRIVLVSMVKISLSMDEIKRSALMSLSRQYSETLLQRELVSRRIICRLQKSNDLNFLPSKYQLILFWESIPSLIANYLHKRIEHINIYLLNKFFWNLVLFCLLFLFLRPL